MMTLTELDEIGAEATAKAENASLAARFPVIYWGDGQTIILHPDGSKDVYPPGMRPSLERN